MENSIKESIERLKLCSTNQCHIYGRYEKEECMLERNRCEQHILSDYKRVLKENEEIRIKNNAIKRESEAYLEYMIRLDNELNLEKEKSKYEWIRQNCLPQELVNKLYIPVQKVKDKIEELEQKREEYYNENKLIIDNIINKKEFYRKFDTQDIHTYAIFDEFNAEISLSRELIEGREKK